MRKTPLLAAAFALALGACANQNRIDTTYPANAPSTAAMPRTASGFLSAAAQSGMLEVNASTLALNRAASPAVRSFAQRMIDDHTLANQELTRLAAERNMPLPTTPTPEQRAMYDRLAGLSGPAFDRAYADSVGVTAHTDAVNLFRMGSTSVEDTGIRSFAQRTLPRLAQHLAEAKRLQSDVGR